MVKMQNYMNIKLDSFKHLYKSKKVHLKIILLYFIKEINKIQKSGIPRSIIEEKLKTMQRKLSEIAEIPKILSSTLETVTSTFEILNPDLKTNYIQNEDEYNQKYHFKPIGNINDEQNSISDEKESGTQDDFSNPDSDEPKNSNEININDDDDDDDEYFEADSLDGDFKQNNLFKQKTINESPESDYISDEDDGRFCSPIIPGLTTSPLMFKLSDDNHKCMPELKTAEEEDEDNDDDDEEWSNISERKDLNYKQNFDEKENLEKANKGKTFQPWQDRQKIIYKVSTCHLVPRLKIVQNTVKGFGAGEHTVPIVPVYIQHQQQQEQQEQQPQQDSCSSA